MGWLATNVVGVQVTDMTVGCRLATVTMSVAELVA